MKALDLSGQTFGRLSVIRYSGNDNSGKTRWLCECECGGLLSLLEVRTGALRSGNTMSCGCLKSLIAATTGREKMQKYGRRRTATPIDKVRERFWTYVQKGDPDDCWLWMGHRNIARGGYGSYRIDGRMQRAHRVAFMLTYGEIPKGHHVCHACDNPPCCNPGHLFSGTPKANTQDGIKKGRITHDHLKQFHGMNAGEKNGQSKLTDDDVRAIRAAECSSRRDIEDLADKHGVVPSAIHGIRSRQRWRHL